MVNKQTVIVSLVLGLYFSILAVSGITAPITKPAINTPNPPATKPDCIISLVRQSDFVCELVRLQDQYYLRCALATRDTILFNPIMVLAINFPDTTTMIKWRVIDHHIQAKLGAMPDELFIFAVDSTQLFQILKRPDQMALLLVGLPNNMIVVKIDYATKKRIRIMMGTKEI